jgi:glycosyltransferase involved in cell wall biosynthesis
VTPPIASNQPQRSGSLLPPPPHPTRPLVSVVTPVHNGELYLRQCIESVLAQTYDHWEYTILDNCSTDRSLEIAQSYAALDRRIVVLSNASFLPQVKNLNKALSVISPDSKYSKMVLADDWIFPHCLEEMVRVAEQHPSAAIVSSYRLDDRRVNCAGLPPDRSLFAGRDICRATLVNGIFVFGSPNTLLYRSDIVRQRLPFFNETSLHEDTEACYEILMEHDLGFVHQVLTFTRRQNGSLSASRMVPDPHHLLDQLIATLKYGPRCLDPEHYDSRRRQVEKAYYRFLAVRILNRANSAFWQYHRTALETVGYEIRRRKLAKQVVFAMLARIANPWRVVHFGGSLNGATREEAMLHQCAGPAADGDLPAFMEPLRGSDA